MNPAQLHVGNRANRRNPLTGQKEFAIEPGKNSYSQYGLDDAHNPIEEMIVTGQRGGGYDWSNPDWVRPIDFSNTNFGVVQPTIAYEPDDGGASANGILGEWYNTANNAVRNYLNDVLQEDEWNDPNFQKVLADPTRATTNELFRARDTIAARMIGVNRVAHAATATLAFSDKYGGMRDAFMDQFQQPFVSYVTSITNEINRRGYNLSDGDNINRLEVSQ
jgi:hypothetical protein